MQIITKLKQFLLTNTSSKQTVIKNTFWLLLAEGISKGSLAVLVIMIGRIFGKEVFGQYSYLSVLLTFLIVFADLGITQLTIRDYQHLDVKHRRQYLISGLWTKLRLSIAVAVVYCIILFAIGGGLSSLRGSGADEAILASTKPSSSFLRLIGLILLSNNLTNSFLEYMRSTFRSLQRGETELRVKFVQGIGNLLLIPLLFVYQSLPLNLIGQSVVTLVTIGYTWYLVRNRQLTEHSEEIITTKKQLIQNGWMFAMSGLAVMVYYYIDTIIIKYYFGFDQVGVYNAAYRISTVLIIPAVIMMSNITVDINKSYRDGGDLLKKVYHYLGICVACAFILFLIAVYGSEFIVYFLYGNDFIESAGPLKYLIFASGLIFINCCITAVLTGIHKEKIFMKITILTLIFNLIMNLWLVPIYGILGSARVTLMTELFTLVTMVGILIYFRKTLRNEKGERHNNIV